MALGPRMCAGYEGIPFHAVHYLLGATALVPPRDQYLGVQGIVHIIDTALEPDESSTEPDIIHTALANLEDGQRNNGEPESAGSTKHSRSFPLSQLLAPMHMLDISLHLKANQHAC